VKILIHAMLEYIDADSRNATSVGADIPALFPTLLSINVEE